MSLPNSQHQYQLLRQAKGFSLPKPGRLDLWGFALGLIIDGVFIVTLALLMIGVRGQLNADFNAQAKDIADKRDAWCKSSNAHDRNYNASEKAYYRSTRQTIYSDSVTDSFLFYNNYDTTRWIQTMRWATGLLLVLIILSFISWIIWLGFCCAPK